MISPRTIAISGRHIRKAIVLRRRMSRRMLARGRAAVSASCPGYRRAMSTMAFPSPVESRHRRGETAMTLFGLPPPRRERPDQAGAASSGPQEAFELALRPLDHLVDRLVALAHLGDHDRVDRLVVDLGRDVRPRRVAGDARLLVAARRIIVDRAVRRLDLPPGVEVVIALERRQVVADRRLDELARLLLLREELQQVLARRLVLRERPQAVEERQDRK